MINFIIFEQTNGYFNSGSSSSSSYGFGDSNDSVESERPEQILEQTLESPSSASAGTVGGGGSSSGGGGGGSSSDNGKAKAGTESRSEGGYDGEEGVQHPAPEPYQFTYETMDEYGTKLVRTESGDAEGNVQGSYMFRDKDGLYRTVKYGDTGAGFTAQIQTNEPGVISHKPADAEYVRNEGEWMIMNALSWILYHIINMMNFEALRLRNN